MSQLFLGLDPSLSRTGYCLLSEESKVIYAGVIRTTKKTDDLQARLYAIGNYVELLVKGKASLRVGVEGLAFGPYQMRTEQVWAAYAVRRALFKRGIPFIDLYPTSIKKYITGAGNTKKNLILKFVLEKFGYSFDDDNVADAFGVARLLYDLWNPPATVTEQRGKQLASLRKSNASYFKQTQTPRLENWRKWADIQKQKLNYYPKGVS